MNIIDKIKEKIKVFMNSKWLDESFWIILVFFVAIGSFALGMRYQRELTLDDNPIRIEKNEAVVRAWNDYIKNKISSANYFASKNGTVYYPLACISGDRILEKNRIYFESEKKAIGAGYKKSKRCN